MLAAERHISNQFLIASQAINVFFFNNSLFHQEITKLGMFL